MDMSSIAAAQRTDSYSVRKNEGHNDIYFDMFPNEIEREIFLKIEEAWENKNTTKMFHLIEVRTTFKVKIYMYCSMRVS